MNEKFPMGLLALSLAFGIVQSIHYYPALPDVVASHFNLSGEPDGWSTKGVLLSVHLVLLGVFMGVFGWLPRWFERLPDARLNLPRKDYWLAPERRERTLRFVRLQMLWCGVGTVFLINILFREVIRANLRPEPLLNDALFWPILGLYFIFMIAWAAGFVIFFQRAR